MANAKIGDYIHWKYQAYKDYGLGTREHPDSKNVINQEALRQQKKSVLSEVKLKGVNKKQIKDSLEAQLNFFYNRNSNQANLVKDVSNVDLHGMIIRSIKNRLGDFVVLDENLKASISNEVMEKKYGKLKAGGKNNSAIAIYNRLAYIKNYADMINNKIASGKSATVKQEEIVQSYNSIITEFQTILKNSKETLAEWLGDAKAKGFDPSCIQAIELESREIIRNEQKFTQTIMKGRRHQVKESFIKSLNDLVKAVNAASAAYYTGLAGEMYVALVLQMGQLKAKNEVENLLADFEKSLIDSNIGLVGQNSSYSAMNSKRFAVTGTNKNFFTSFDGQNSVELIATQDKVDVHLTLNDGQKFNASVKNYNLSDTNREITILNGTNIMKYLSTYPIFVNHYLNMTATTLSEPISKENYSYRDKIPASLIMKANQTVLLTLTLKALAGGVEKLSLDKSSFSKNLSAELFIINDNSQGGFKVFFIEDIINLIASNSDKITNYITMSGYSETFRPYMYWKGDKRNYSNAFSRINALLSIYESQKIHITIKQNVLNNI